MNAAQREREALDFSHALAGGGLPKDERLIMNGFPGDPFTAKSPDWRPRPWGPGQDFPLNVMTDNGYVSVGSFRQYAADGSWRRRAEGFAAGRALMVDDIGTKVPLAVMAGAPEPSAVIETSPSNYQWWYFFDEPERDAARFDAVIRAFIDTRLLGADPGMGSITRVGRVPGCINGKPSHSGWVVRTEALRPGLRYSVQQLVDGFGLRLDERQRQHDLRTALVGAEERVEAFYAVLRFLQVDCRMLKRDEPDPSGWYQITCPWTADHTARADNGAAIRKPAPENNFSGAFRCMHGHCVDKRWRDLTEWAAELAAEKLEDAAAQAHKEGEA